MIDRHSYQQGSFCSPVAKPPAGSSLLFGALADSGRIKERKNGSYRMVLKGVDEIDWFTDRPDRVEGTWKPQKLLRKWDNLFATSEPNAQATVEIGGQRELFAFEMFKPKIKSGKMMFNIKPISNSSEDKVIGLKNMEVSDVSLFIDDANTSETSTTWQNELNIGLVQSVGKDHADLSRRNLMNAVLNRVDLTNASLIDTNLNGASLTDANLTGANLISVFLGAANLTDANLFEANLTGAYLHDANLNGANLNNANLFNAYLPNANLSNANLTGATYDSATTWPTADSWDNTTCPDGTNSNNNPSCGF